MPPLRWSPVGAATRSSSCLEKTLGVSVAFLADAVRKLGIDLAKAGTEENESDLMTKVLPAVKVALCNSRLGVLRDSTLDQLLAASARG